MDSSLDLKHVTNKNVNCILGITSNGTFLVFMELPFHKAKYQAGFPNS